MFNFKIVRGDECLHLFDDTYLYVATGDDISALQQLYMIGIYDGSDNMLGCFKTLPMQYCGNMMLDVHAYIPKENRRHSLKILKQYSTLLLDKGYKIHTSTDKGYEQTAKMLVKLLGFTITEIYNDGTIHLIKENT